MPTVEASLVVAARGGSMTAWDALLRQHQLPLYSYSAEFIGDRSAAFDIVQETFVRAVRHIASLREDGKFSSWLFGIAHQACLQHFRRVRRNDGLFAASLDEDGGAEPEAEEEGDPLTRLMQREESEAFFARMEQLPAAQRSVLLLHVLEDFSQEEIATITGVPVGTVKSRLFQAKRAMRRLLEETP